MQVDKGRDIVSNFLSNFMRQFRNRENKGLMQLLGSLWAFTPKTKPQPVQPPDIMGPAMYDAGLARERRERYEGIKRMCHKIS